MRPNYNICENNFDAYLTYEMPNGTHQSSTRVAARTFHERFFQVVMHGNFLSAMYGFRDNGVPLPTGYDVIMFHPPGALHVFF